MIRQTYLVNLPTKHSTVKIQHFSLKVIQTVLIEIKQTLNNKVVSFQINAIQVELSLIDAKSLCILNQNRASIILSKSLVEIKLSIQV